MRYGGMSVRKNIRKNLDAQLQYNSYKVLVEFYLLAAYN